MIERAKWITMTEGERGKALRSLVGSWRACQDVADMIEGDKYFRGRNTEIMSRKKQFFAEAGQLVDDPYKANYKIPSGYFGLLVSQKVQYLLGNGVRIVPKAIVAAAPAAPAPGAPAPKPQAPDVTPLEGVLGRRFEKKVQQAAKEAAKKRVAWAYVYIDGAGAFAIKTDIPSEQLLPIMNADGETLDMMIRMYDSKDEQGNLSTTVDVYDAEQVATYKGSTTGGEAFELKQDAGLVNPRRYITKRLKYGDQVAEESFSSWGGRVPWVPLWNNDDRTNDLTPAVKGEIDAYDVVMSDFANNLADVQDIYWIVKNYGGEDLSKFLNDLKRYKSIKVGDEGDVRAEKIDIPTEAREKLLDKLNEAIFRDGRGVDPSMVGDGNITNVVIRNRYAGLDLKADEFEWQVSEFVSGIIAFAFLFMQEKKIEPSGYDYDVNFVRRMIMNEIELLDSNVKQQGAISEETRLANHPWVTDPDAELARMQAGGTVSLDDNGDGQDDGNADDAAAGDSSGGPGGEGAPGGGPAEGKGAGAGGAGPAA